jgi:hypothetical protein
MGDLLGALARVMRTSIPRKEGTTGSMPVVEGNTVLTWLESSGAADGPTRAATLAQELVQAGVLVPVTDVQQGRFNAGATYTIEDPMKRLPLAPSALLLSPVTRRGTDASWRDSLGSFALDTVGLSLAVDGGRNSMSDMLAGMQLPHSLPGSSIAPFRPSTMSGALVAGGVDMRRDLGLSIAVPATDTRVDGAGTAYTVFGIRVALGADSAPPWMVWRRYKQFETLHRALDRRVPLSGAASPRGEAEGGSEEGSLVTGLPDLPGKGVRQAISSALGVGNTMLTRTFVESRRGKLEEYMKALALAPGAWAGEDLVAFLDNDSRTLSAHLTNLRMLSTQRLLTYVVVNNSRRQAKVERKVSATAAAVDSMSRKMDRLEALLAESRERASRGSRDMDSRLRKSSRGQGSDLNTTVPPVRSRAIIADYFERCTGGEREGSSSFSHGSVEPSAAAYVESFGPTVLALVDAPKSSSTQADRPPAFRSRDALGTALGGEEVNSILEWLFGTLGSGLNPCSPLDGSAALGGDPPVTAADLDARRAANLEAVRYDASESMTPDGRPPGGGVGRLRPPRGRSSGPPHRWAGPPIVWALPSCQSGWTLAGFWTIPWIAALPCTSCPSCRPSLRSRMPSLPALRLPAPLTHDVTRSSRTWRACCRR